SQTTVALISNVPGQIGFWLTRANGQRPPNTARNVYEARPQEILTAEQNFASREFINAVAGSTRALSQGMMYMGRGTCGTSRSRSTSSASTVGRGTSI